LSGPLVIGNISGRDTASAGLYLRGAASVVIAGGDLGQANGQPISVDGTPRLEFTAGVDSHGRPLPASRNAGRFMRDGQDVTSTMAP
jgi:hypothetical protein